MSPNRISHIREEKELTQQQLADILGGSRVNISNWENEREFPNIRRINEVADYFQVSLDYLFHLSNKKTYPDIHKGEIDKIKAGKRLKEFRVENHLTLRKLAEQLNTTSSTLSAYETGKTLLLTAFAIEICQKYNLSMDWLYGKRDNNETKDYQN